MSDKHFPDPEIIPPSATTQKRSGWKTPLIVAGLLALGVTGAVATTAFADGGFGPGGFGPPWRHGWHGGDRGQMDPAQINKMIERGVKHLAVDIDATPDQTAKLVQIATSAATDLRPLRDQLRDARKQGRDLLSAPTLDRGQIETFRAQQMALMDQISKRVAQAVGDAAEVLTPEQRAKVGDRLERFGEFRRGGPGRGWGPFGRDRADMDRPGPQNPDPADAAPGDLPPSPDRG
jgi:Spy/CpxP family protein refolding chaperone